MHNYKELDLSVSPLRDDFQFPKDTGDSHMTFKIDVEKSLNPDLIKFFGTGNSRVNNKIIKHILCKMRVLLRKSGYLQKHAENEYVEYLLHFYRTIVI
jgi:hypothetical protein